MTEVRCRHIGARLAGGATLVAVIGDVARAESILTIAVAGTANLRRLTRALRRSKTSARSPRTGQVDDEQAALSPRARQAAALTVARIGDRVDAFAAAASLGGCRSALHRFACRDRAIGDGRASDGTRVRPRTRVAVVARRTALAGVGLRPGIVRRAGVLALGSFAYFGLAGRSIESDLDRCVPYCQKDDVDRMRARYLVADLSLVVAAGSLGVGAYLFLRGHDTEPTHAFSPPLRLRVDAAPDRAGVSIRKMF
jgi:hypothetical protein